MPITATNKRVDSAKSGDLARSVYSRTDEGAPAPRAKQQSAWQANFPKVLFPQICSYLLPKEICQVAPICRQWKLWSQEFWKTLCEEHEIVPMLSEILEGATTEDINWNSEYRDHLMSKAITYVGPHTLLRKYGWRTVEPFAYSVENLRTMQTFLRTRDRLDPAGRMHAYTTKLICFFKQVKVIRGGEEGTVSITVDNLMDFTPLKKYSSSSGERNSMLMLRKEQDHSFPYSFCGAVLMAPVLSEEETLKTQSEKLVNLGYQPLNVTEVFYAALVGDLYEEIIVGTSNITNRWGNPRRILVVGPCYGRRNDYFSDVRVKWHDMLPGDLIGAAAAAEVLRISS